MSMAKNRYLVEFSIGLCTSRVIAADTEEEAQSIAEELRFDDDFFNDIIDSWENDYDQWRGKYCEVTTFERVSDDEPAANEEE